MADDGVQVSIIHHDECRKGSRVSAVFAMAATHGQAADMLRPCSGVFRDMLSNDTGTEDIHIRLPDVSTHNLLAIRRHLDTPGPSIPLAPPTNTGNKLGGTALFSLLDI